MAYVDPGLMNKKIDIWDRPPNALPVLFAGGINAQILGVASTTQSPSSTSLNQQIAWPRLVGQDISLITHSVVILYMSGLKSRMFIVYDDPDNGPRRFDIDRIVDLDEQKVELNLLVFERCDGADPFDALLTSTADILSRDTSVADKRGMSDPTFTTIATGIPCRVGVGKAASKGKEERSKTAIAIAYREVYMRPWFLDPSPDGSFVPYTVVGGFTYNTVPLTHNHWLLIPSSTAVNSNNQPIPGEEYDILEIDNPGLAHHHLEISCELVLA
jgi:hypothetical protein